MDKTLKRKWVKALRSGQYRQGKKVLCRSTPRGDYFCCLGVLADVRGEKWVEASKNKKGVLAIADGPERHETQEYGHDLLHQEHRQFLMRMNDFGKRFTTIANWIEKNIQED